jgi:hypothetical protein
LAAFTHAFKHRRIAIEEPQGPLRNRNSGLHKEKYLLRNGL